MVEQGHVVADHSWTHASLPSLDTAGLRRELVDTRAAILKETGRVPTLMRPPFGDFTAKTNEFSRRQGMLPVLWTVDSNDWALSDPGTIAANVLNSPALKPGAIILLHDGSMNRQMTVDALPLILDGLVARGLRSVTVPELLRAGQPSIASPGDYKLSDYADASN
jgi:peptidoglycan/xylan/chitin deacetylase (PgdA/CDA1 family)